MTESSETIPPKKQVLVRKAADSFEAILVGAPNNEKESGNSAGEALGNFTLMYGKKCLGIEVFKAEDGIGDNTAGMSRLVITKVCEGMYNGMLAGARAGDEVSIGRSVAEAVGNYLLTYDDKFKLFEIIKK